VQYPVESFTEDECVRLRAHFTNLDRPVFALVDLPETVKGALFARYSRYPGTLRRMFLDEFAADLPPMSSAFAGEEGHRASQLYERIFLGYGDDSVAQLGGAHLACEWVSNVLTKILQRPRLGAYLEQSTRYIAYDAQMPAPPGGYRYYRDAELGPDYERAMDELFSIYAHALPRVCAWAEREFPRGSTEPAAAHTRAIRAKALDLLRGLLPASSLSHMGIFATGQSYEQLILHLLAHPLPEARSYGTMILDEIKAVIETAHSLGMKVAAHAHGKQAIDHTIALGVDYWDETTSDLEEIGETGGRLVLTRHGRTFRIHCHLLVDASGPRGFLHLANLIGLCHCVSSL